MTEQDIKKELIQRIVAHFNPVPANAVQELLSQSVGELEVILDKLVATKAQSDSNATVEAQVEEMRRVSAFEAAYTSALRNITIHGRRLTDSEATKNMLESLLNPGELPTLAIYQTLALQFASRFSWETPKAKPTQEDQRKAFDAFVRERGLSSCEANFHLFRDGASEEHFAAESGIERAARQAQQAQERQHFLIHDASPTQLKQESTWESQQNREQAQRDEATRSHQYVLSQQGHYPPLPATMPDTNEVIDSKFIRKLSTINYPLFRAWVKKYGVGNLNSRLRGEN
jgi:hypothetical protein